jgi:hypothetical protein
MDKETPSPSPSPSPEPPKQLDDLLGSLPSIEDDTPIDDEDDEEEDEDLEAKIMDL